MQINEVILPTKQDIQLAENCRHLLAMSDISHPLKIQIQEDPSTMITLPARAVKLLVEVLRMMAKGNAVTLFPVHAHLTTQQAADIMNVSRPYLVKLLESGALSFHKVGTHRRILLQDLLAFKKKTMRDREQALDDLAGVSQDIGLGYDAE